MSRDLAGADAESDVAQLAASSEALHLGQEATGVVAGGMKRRGAPERDGICGLPLLGRKEFVRNLAKVTSLIHCFDDFSAGGECTPSETAER